MGSWWDDDGGGGVGGGGGIGGCEMGYKECFRWDHGGGGGGSSGVGGGEMGYQECFRWGDGHGEDEDDVELDSNCMYNTENTDSVGDNDDQDSGVNLTKN